MFGFIMGGTRTQSQVKSIEKRQCEEKQRPEVEEQVTRG
jgi:hypothetical protein